MIIFYSIVMTEGESGKGQTTQQSSSEPKLFRRSTLLIKKRGSRKSNPAAAVSPAKDSKSPEESITSLTETIEEDSSGKDKSIADVGSGEDSDSKYRLQRQKAQSRNTFRFRKGSRKGVLAKGSEGGGTQALTEEETNTAEKQTDDEDLADETSQLLKRDQKGSDRESFTVNFPPSDNSCL